MVRRNHNLLFFTKGKKMNDIFEYNPEFFAELKKNNDDFLITGVPENVYHNDNFSFCSSSRLKALAKSPAHVFVEKNETPALAFGRLVHELVLTKKEIAIDSFSENFASSAILDEDDFFLKNGVKFKKDRKEFIETYFKKTIISEDYFNAAKKINLAVRKNELVKELFRDGFFELSAYRNLTAAGGSIYCKARADFFSKNYVVDLKTSDLFLPEDFSREIVNYRYDLQAAFYCRMFDVKHFFWIVAEKKAPYSIAVYEADAEMLEIAAVEVDFLLSKWHDWKSGNESFQFSQKRIESINYPDFFRINLNKYNK